MPQKWLPCTAIALAFALGATDAAADDGPLTALKNMLHASPTLTIVASSVVLLADGSFAVVGAVDAVQGRDESKPFYVTEAIVAAPQAIGFSLVPFFFDIVRWKPEENLLLVLPAQIASSSLAAHGLWSSVSTSIEPGPRFGLSLMIGANWAFTANAFGCLTQTRWSPLEIGVVQAGLMTPEVVVSIERMINDEEHRFEWGVLMAWSAIMSAHGVASIADGIISVRPGQSYDAPSATAAPFVAPVREGFVAGAAGEF